MVSTIGSTVVTGIDNTVKSVPIKNFFIVMLLPKWLTSYYTKKISHLSLLPSFLLCALKTQNPVTGSCDRAWSLFHFSIRGRSNTRYFQVDTVSSSTPIIEKVKKKMIAECPARQRPVVSVTSPTASMELEQPGKGL